MHLLNVQQLQITDSLTGRVLVADSSFSLEPEECLAIVGESGSGKSLTCRAVMGLNRPTLRQSGSILWHGAELLGMREQELRNIRGKQIAMIMQHGMRAFDPSRRMGPQLGGALAAHYSWGRAEAAAKLRQALERVGFKDAQAVLDRYPHELSGGMLQRAMIALAIALGPELIIADEPTTALDTVTQYEVVEQFVRLRNDTGSALIFVSHDLGVVRQIADRVLVMKDGEIVERGSAAEIFTEARHPYTRYLVSSKQALNRHFRQLMGGSSLAEG